MPTEGAEATDSQRLRRTATLLKNVNVTTVTTRYAGKAHERSKHQRDPFSNARWKVGGGVAVRKKNIPRKILQFYCTALRGLFIIPPPGDVDETWNMDGGGRVIRGDFITLSISQSAFPSAGWCFQSLEDVRRSMGVPPRGGAPFEILVCSFPTNTRVPTNRDNNRTTQLADLRVPKGRREGVGTIRESTHKLA